MYTNDVWPIANALYGKYAVNNLICSNSIWQTQEFIINIVKAIVLLNMPSISKISSWVMDKHP